MKPNINNKFLSRSKMAANKKFKKSLKYLGGGGHNLSWPRILNYV